MSRKTGKSSALGAPYGASGKPKINDCQGKRQGGESANEAEHFMVCNGCGKTFDCRDLYAVFYHEMPGHSAPLTY